MRIHLVDGTYELFRAFFSSPRRVNAAGQEVGAVVGLARSLLLLIREEGVTHIACAFDHTIESFRNRLYSGYKSSEGIDPVILSQFDLAEVAARSLGLVVWPMVEFETDDALATAANRWKDREIVDQVVICSPDKDFAQCVRGMRVVCLDRRKGLRMDRDGVRRKFGVEPASIPDWLALTGDSADGFPGISGWGAKTASRVLARYPHLEQIPEDAGGWEVAVRGAHRLNETLRQSWNQALLFRQLATLRTDVPLAETLRDLQWGGVPRGAFSRLMQTLGNPNLATRVERWAE